MKNTQQRINTTKHGTINFDGEKVTSTATTKTLNIDDICKAIFASVENEERILLCYNVSYDEYIRFKVLKPSEFKAIKPFYFNGSAQSASFGFRMLSSLVDILEDCDDLCVNAEGDLLVMTEDDLQELYEEALKLNLSVNRGNVTEYAITHNILDITQPKRAKKHDLYIYAKNAKGEVCKVKKACECKASYGGFAKHALRNGGLTAGYKKSNDFIRINAQLEIL